MCAVSLSNLLQPRISEGSAYVYDHEKIESLLLRDREGQSIAARYFPVSFKNYILENPVPAELFSNLEPLVCERCGKNLLDVDAHGIYCLLKEDLGEDESGLPIENKVSANMYFSCKGECDEVLKARYREENLWDNGWYDIDDLCIPTLWISRLMAFMNGIYYDQDLGPEAFRKTKQMFLRTYPHVARHLTSAEKERVENLLMFGVL